MMPRDEPLEGLLLLDKPAHKSSFYLVQRIRALTGVKKVGHAGTLDPFATGLMILLVGKNYTRQSDRFLMSDKMYDTTLRLGFETATFDLDSEPHSVCDRVPSIQEVHRAIEAFQGLIQQVPPMYSAKKVGGVPLYKLARRDVVVERAACAVNVEITLLDYSYPYLSLRVRCSKGTYIRSLGHDIGKALGVGAYLTALRRLSSGNFSIDDACTLDRLEADPALIGSRLVSLVS
jgi:tRNA pseudouridine55 synthase